MAEKEASAPANSAAAVTVSNEIMVATVIFLFMVVAFVFVLYLYAKRYVGANPVLGRFRSRSGPRFVFAAELAPCGGLHPAVLTALPVAAYRAENYKEGLECAVCLSQVSEGERIRLLPDCDHGFHVECIDMWFHSHSTCPLCRTLVAAQPADPAAGSAGIRRPQDVSGNGSSRESPALPTNVLFWGIQGGVSAQEGASSSSGSSSSSSSSSSSTRKDTRKEEGVLMIEIPRRCFPGSPAPISPLEEIKSPSLARLRSLKRLLSRGKQATGASCSPNGGDIV